MTEAPIATEHVRDNLTPATPAFAVPQHVPAEPPGHAHVTTPTTDDALPDAAMVPDIPWWAYAIFGVVCVLIAMCVHLLTTRCPCADAQTGDGHDHERAHAATAGSAGHAGERADERGANAHLSTFVCEWADANAPTEHTKLQFLSTEAPYDTYACSAASLFAAHKRVRLALPRGLYMLRATFADGTQHVVTDVPSHNETVATLTERTLTSAAGGGAALPAAAAHAGACARM